jgi:hypothetical protein
MIIQSHRRSILILLLIVIAILVFVFGGCSQEAHFPSDLGSYNQTGNYRIDPETILTSLDQGETNVFTPMLATPSSEDQLLPPGSIPWTQADYLKIAAALHQHVWKEALDVWSIYYLAFDRECQDNPTGFDSAEITLFKEDGEEYDLRRIEVFPLASEVDWGGEATFPRPFLGRWKKIDLGELSVTADDALRIAEEHGGEEARLRDKNNCRILVRIPNSKNDANWNVNYYFSPSFEVIINPYTGEYELLNEVIETSRKR